MCEEDNWLMTETPNGTETNTAASLSEESIFPFELVTL
jgi:hypothetical protein